MELANGLLVFAAPCAGATLANGLLTAGSSEPPPLVAPLPVTLPLARASSHFAISAALSTAGGALTAALAAAAIGIPLGACGFATSFFPPKKDDLERFGTLGLEVEARVPSGGGGAGTRSASLLGSAINRSVVKNQR